jgi:hypothetical protein
MGETAAHPDLRRVHLRAVANRAVPVQIAADASVGRDVARSGAIPCSHREVVRDCLLATDEMELLAFPALVHQGAQERFLGQQPQDAWQKVAL